MLRVVKQEEVWVLKHILHRIMERLAEVAKRRCYTSVPYWRPWRDL